MVFPPFTCFLDLHFLLHPAVLLCGPSAAALTLIHFCPTIRKRKSHFPNFPKVCLALERPSLCLPSFFLWSFFIPIKDRLWTKLFAFLPPFHFSVFYLLALFSSPSTSLPFSFLELATFQPDNCFLQRCLDPFPGCFLPWLVFVWGFRVSPPWLFSSKVFGSFPLLLLLFSFFPISSWSPSSITSFHPLVPDSAARVGYVNLLDHAIHFPAY